MGRTIRRAPFTVEVDNDDFNINYYNQAEFKGINTNKNDATADPTTFADANNVYVDENSLLVSRPPVKVSSNDAWILKEWMFGQYGVRLHRLVTDADGNRVDSVENRSIDTLYYTFLFRCFTHTSNNVSITVSIASIGWNVEPEYIAVQIEDKIYFWFGGTFLFNLNLKGATASDGTYLPWFEESVKYLYIPVHKLVTNGVETELETKNFLTKTYRRRYQYSNLSSVNFDTLIGKCMEVSLNGDMTQNTSKHLYTLQMQERQDMMLIYPYAECGNTYYIDIVQAPRATVFMRYNLVTHIIEISFDGRSYRGLPVLDDMIGKPLLTRDGLWCVAFTRRGVAECKLAAQDEEDIVTPENTYSWVIVSYARNNLAHGLPAYFDTIDATFEPKGYFETIDNFAYIFRAKNIYTNVSETYIPYVYTEWLAGTNDTVWGLEGLLSLAADGSTLRSMVADDNMHVHFRYVSPTMDHQDLGGVVSLLLSKANVREQNAAGTIVDVQKPLMNVNIFKFNTANVARSIINEDSIALLSDFGTVIGSGDLTYIPYYIHRLNAAGTQVVNSDPNIYANDIVILSSFPLYQSDKNDYKTDVIYERYDCVTYSSKIYRAKKSTVGNAPSGTTSDNDYWEYITASTFTFSYTKDGESHTAQLPWSVGLLLMSGTRYRVSLTNGEGGIIYPGDRVEFSSIDFSIVYTGQDLEDYFGNFPDAGVSWSDFRSITIAKPSTQTINTGNVYINNMSNPVSLDVGHVLNILTAFGDGAHVYRGDFFAPAEQFDIQCMSPVITSTDITYDIVAAYCINGEAISGNQTLRMPFNVFLRCTLKSSDSDETGGWTNKANIILNTTSRNFEILSDADVVLTDTYMWLADVNNESISVVLLPRNGELSNVITDKARNVISSDYILIGYQDGDRVVQKWGNLFKLSTDGIYLATGEITSGSLVSLVEYADTEYDYLKSTSGRFYIEKLAISNGQWVVASGSIRYGDLIRFRAYDKNIVLPANSPGNPTDTAVTIYPSVYPAPPTNWSVGDDWPTTDDWATIPKPLFPNADGTVRVWQAGDNLPTGAICYYGNTNILRQYVPICIGDNGVWYNITGSLWTSQLTGSNILELDEYIDGTLEITDVNNIAKTYVVNYTVPTHYGMLNTHFLSYYYKGKNLLEISADRRDERKLYSEDGDDLLLYFPLANEQNIATAITNLHNLSQSAMGMWTEDSMYYVSSVEDENLGLVYTKPIKSKIPMGCREGDDIITALDGQVIIYPTPRGIAALAPEDFIASTERTMTYISDTIQDIYYHLYNDAVPSAALVPDEFKIGHKPMIKICTYKYWIIFWRYMDKEVYAFDTRNASWWKWSLPYPIRDVMQSGRLHFLEQIDFNPIEDSVINIQPKKLPLMGIDFLWTDRETDIITKEGNFPVLADIAFSNTDYYDDTIDGALNGDSLLIYENKFVGSRRQLLYAEPTIKWHFVSQKIAFGALNNYKTVKQLIVNAKGTDAILAKIYTKAFRDMTHPEKSIVVEIDVNDLRTFIKRLNLMHVIDFQYRLESDASEDTHVQLKLNAIGIKYEVKENIR